MNFIEKLIMGIVWLAMIFFTTVLFSGGVYFGLAGIIGMIVFYLAWGLSNDFAIAPRDWWDMPDFDVFLKKLGWSIGIAGAAGLIFLFIVGAI